MADVAISGLTALGGAPATNDLLVEVDVSDTTQAPTGTTKKMTVANLFTSPHMTGAVVDSGGLTVTLGSITAPTIVTNSTTALSTTQNTLAFLGGATDTQFKNSANNATNVTITDAGAVTVRAGLTATTGAFSGDFAIATNKFTVAAASGNTAIAGTLIVQGAIQSVTGTLNIAGQADFGGVVETTASFNAITSVYKVNSVQVVGARSTGWATQTVTTGAKTDIGASGTWTTTSVGNLLMAHHAALLAHGLIGA